MVREDDGACLWFLRAMNVCTVRTVMLCFVFVGGSGVLSPNCIRNGI